MAKTDRIEGCSLKSGYAFARVGGEWEIVVLPSEHVGCTNARRYETIDGALCVVFRSHRRWFAQTRVAANDRIATTTLVQYACNNRIDWGA